ncbi:MAG: hypothetical protein QXT64_02980 [Desulfurococcaceae archaeon]
MRILDYIASGFTLAIFFAVFVFTVGLIYGVMAMVTGQLIDVTSFIVTLGLVAGLGFVGFVFFDYVYDLIVGEE